MSENTKTDLGEIKIHRNVIATITTEATLQVAGVLRIGSNIKAKVFEMLGQKDNSSIVIDVDANNETTISIPIIVQYGYNIPEVASKIQESVKTAIENATNTDIKEINVIIQEIEKKEQGGAE